LPVGFPNRTLLLFQHHAVRSKHCSGPGSTS
jgi:hypothetical protein